MHAFSHSLAHRAPPATRTRVRWQPYSTISQCSSSTISSKSPSSQISTPSSSITSPLSNTLHIESKPTFPQNHKEFSLSRDSSKNKYAVGLVDQTVKTLCEIWRPQDIPRVFLSSSRAGATLGASLESSDNKISRRVPSCISATPTLSTTSPIYASDAKGKLVPIKGFVHEVIRRSRTSGCVLQTALCYLEAIRVRVPDLVKAELSGQGIHGEPDLSSRITPATGLELQLEEQYMQLESGLEDPVSSAGEVYPTVRLSDMEPTSSCKAAPLTMSGDSDDTRSDSTDQSMAALPSPLLCPRRTFLASLILASKFTQDKCYSNRAWAKLSGLPAREIGRCERALGEALEWRLWVGKAAVQSQTPSGPSLPNVSNRPVVRSQSESNILTHPSTRSPFLVRSEARHPPALQNTKRILQKSLSMPAESFAAPSGVPPDPRPISLKGAQQSSDGLFGSTSHVYADVLSQSPSPDNPGLSYSPSSTESSCGDRTIQMSTFIDEPMVTYSVSQAPAATEFWPWSDNSDVFQDLRISPVALPRSKQTAKLPAIHDPSIYVAPGPGISAREPLGYPGSTVVPNLLWPNESENHRLRTSMAP